MGTGLLGKADVLRALNCVPQTAREIGEYVGLTDSQARKLALQLVDEGKARRWWEDGRYVFVRRGEDV